MYDWVKALHVIAVMSWMAGMLYLPRLFVYHCEAKSGSKESETFKMMEQGLLKIIIGPAMALTWITGFYLVLIGQWYLAAWFYVKFVMVIGLTGLYGFFAIQVGNFSLDRNTHTQIFFRIINEIPAIIMAVIVIMVIVKPF